MIKIITSEHYQRIKNKGPGRRRNVVAVYWNKHVRKVHERHLSIFSHIISIRRATT